MPANTLDSSLSQISSVTKKYFFSDIVDQITIANPVLMKLKGKMETIDGGDDIRIPIEIAFQNSQWYVGAESLQVSNVDNFFSAIFNWKQLNVPISIPAVDKLKNMGAAKVVDIVKAKVANAKKTVMNAFGTGIYSSGTDPKSIGGAGVFGSVSATYGGLPQSSESYWQAKVDSTTTNLSLAKMQERYEAASEPPIMPNLISTTETLFNSYHALLTPIQRFQDSKVADAGFQNLLFRGAPVVQDSYCTASMMAFWNTDYVNVYSHAGREFPGEMIDFVMPHDQDVSVAHIRWMGEFICKAPRFFGVMTALTA